MQILAAVLLLFLLALVTSSFSNLNVFYKLNGSDYNSSSLSVINSQVTPYQITYNYNEAKSLARYCDTAAIRTCQVLYQDMKTKYLAGDNSCSNYNNVTTLWSFLGSPNTTGTIDSLYAQQQSSTLNCATPEKYARYLFSKALPQSFTSGKNVTFNLNNLQTSVVEPCGFSEIFE